MQSQESSSGGKEVRFTVRKKEALLEFLIAEHEDAPNFTWHGLWETVALDNPGLKGTKYEGTNVEDLVFKEWQIWYTGRHSKLGDKRAHHGKGSDYYDLMKQWHDLVKSVSQYKKWRSQYLAENHQKEEDGDVDSGETSYISERNTIALSDEEGAAVDTHSPLPSIRLKIGGHPKRMSDDLTKNGVEVMKEQWTVAPEANHYRAIHTTPLSYEANYGSVMAGTKREPGDIAESLQGGHLAQNNAGVREEDVRNVDLARQSQPQRANSGLENMEREEAERAKQHAIMAASDSSNNGNGKRRRSTCAATPLDTEDIIVARSSKRQRIAEELSQSYFNGPKYTVQDNRPDASGQDETWWNTPDANQTSKATATAVNQQDPSSSSTNLCQQAQPGARHGQQLPSPRSDPSEPSKEVPRSQEAGDGTALVPALQYATPPIAPSAADGEDSSLRALPVSLEKQIVESATAVDLTDGARQSAQLGDVARVSVALSPIPADESYLYAELQSRTPLESLNGERLTRDAHNADDVEQLLQIRHHARRKALGATDALAIDCANHLKLEAVLFQAVPTLGTPVRYRKPREEVT
ncbi:hypothetical protein LTR15_000885 [Elasticomyces elasticus]|nr:hypothetical protein LTR15_000885 [Elasticomyces elasticus]